MKKLKLSGAEQTAGEMLKVGGETMISSHQFCLNVERIAIDAKGSYYCISL